MPEIAFQAPFAAQVDFLRNKLAVPTERWDDIWQSAHDRAFMVAGAMKADLLADLHAAVVKAAAQGRGIEDFRADFDKVIEKHGWRDWTGSGSEAGRAWRTRVIYQTNMSTSYAAGRWAQINDPELADFRPYIQYHHADGVAHPRPLHVSWDGLVLPKDHPFWQTHAPPNGWGCHCYLSAAGKKDYERAQAAGKTEPPAGWNVINENTGMPPGIDKGWAYNPGASRSAELQRFAKDKVAALPEPLGQALAKDAAKVAQAVPNQPGWESLGLKDLREMGDRAEVAPPLRAGAASKAEAVDILRSALGVPPGGRVEVATPVERVAIEDASLAHVVDKREDRRERFADLVLPTLERPTEVWATEYDDGSTRHRYIKLFSGIKYDLLVMVRVDPDGSVFWNMMQRERKGMNALRVGTLIHGEGP